MHLSKSKLSQYLRTRCDRSLYLSLHNEAELSAKNLPPALTSRPGVRHLRDSGIELERMCFRRLKAAFPAACFGEERIPEGNWGSTALHRLLSSLTTGTCFLIHPEYQLEDDRAAFLDNLGVRETDQPLIPVLGAHIPDIIGVDVSPIDCSGRIYAVTPTGERLPITETDERRSLTIIDIKHAQEANTSYESEVALYAVALVNWLDARGLTGQFYVAADMCLWTNGGVAAGGFDATARNTDASDADKLSSLKSELSTINAPIYLQAIRRFMSEQLPAVIRKGNEALDDLEWHVCSRCASCDWLGHRDWLSRDDRAQVDANPQNYCFPKAAATGHLSRVPLITRGARHVLETEGIEAVSDLVHATGGEEVFSKHTSLKSDRRSLPALATSIDSGQYSIDEDRADGGLARYADLDVFISVNFDAGAGQLTGIGLEGRFRQHTPYGVDTDVTRIWREQWIVSGKSAEAEGATARAFLNYLASIYDWVRDTDGLRGGAHARETTAQLIFWDHRQYEELCLAIGRHLTEILYADEERTVKALIWLFPPEELQERGDAVNARKPGVAFVSDITRRLVRTPAVHEQTLFNIAEHYHWGDDFNPPDSFYREPLSDSIPRERIYEIWSAYAAGPGYTVQWGTIVKDLSQLMDGFRRAVDKQAAGLRMIVWRLRQDFRDRLKAAAPRLDIVIPNWSPGVAYEAKLWIAWATFSQAFDNVMAQRQYLSDPEELEARYEGVRLTHLINERPDGSLVFAASPESRDAKIRVPEAFLGLSLDDTPGFLSQRVRDLIDDNDLPAHLRDFALLNRTMSSVFKVKLVDFDRETLRVTIEWDNWRIEERQLRQAIFNMLGDRATNNVTLVSTSGGNAQVRRLTTVLRAIGNPPIARPTADTLAALGKSNTRIPAGTSPMTPAAEALWDAERLQHEFIREPGIAGAIANAAQAASVPPLNESQRDAITSALSKRLSVIWGPPGTGKTKTCAAMVHQLAIHEQANATDRPYNILLTGPNYKAVAELAERVMNRMATDPATQANCFIIHREDRENEFTVPERTVGGFSVEMSLADAHEPTFRAMLDSLTSSDGVTVVAAVVHQCPKIAEQAKFHLDDGEDLRPLFDFVLFDESSQADMVISIPCLGLLKDGFQLVFAGDLLQMPPISKCEAPVGAEYLVGSVQNYFVTRFGVTQEELLVNYRSADEIVQYTKSLGYPAGLTAAFPDAQLSFVNDPIDLETDCVSTGLAWSNGWSRVLAPEHRIVALTYEDGVCGQSNPFEADCVVSLISVLRASASNTLVNHGSPADAEHYDDELFWRVGVGVITPHRAQRSIIVRKLTESFPNTEAELIEAAVDTVERFQGGERHTIIISFGVGDPDVIAGEEKFLMQLERINVAISRAMAKCVVLLSDEIAGHIPTDRDAIATAHGLKGVVDEWCTDKLPEVVQLSDGSERPIVVRTRNVSD